MYDLNFNSPSHGQCQTQICTFFLTNIKSFFFLLLLFSGSRLFMRSVWLILMLLVNAIMVYFYIIALGTEKGTIIKCLLYAYYNKHILHLCCKLLKMVKVFCQLINRYIKESFTQIWCICWCSDRIGWACMIAFLQLLWALINFTWSFKWGTVLIICSDHLHNCIAMTSYYFSKLICLIKLFIKKFLANFYCEDTRGYIY